MHPRLILIAAAFMLLGSITAVMLTPSLRDTLFEPATVRSSGKALIGGPFKLVDHTGKAVTEQDFKGRYLLVFFGFTHCPDICPSGLQVISAALDQLGSKADAITPVFITLDPERDTPEKMREYVGSFHPRLIGLTGTPEQVEKAAKAYRVYYKKVRVSGSSEDYSIDHSSFGYLMDREGNFVSHFTPSAGVDKVAEAISKVL